MTQPLSDFLLDEVSCSLAKQTGLHFPRERWPDMERGLSAAAREMEFPSTEIYARHLLSSVWNKAQIETLARHLTIGETYFLRHRESLAALENQVLPELIAGRRRQGRYLRIWCAGCCTGEEPYSIAMLLRRAVPDWKDWSLTILATDINPHFLERARQGIYREWSFRETDPTFRSTYFTNTGQGDYIIHSEIKGMVTFANLNLARDPFPSLVNGTNAMDVILCRNVLMYFSTERAREVLRGLRGSLAPGGWIVVSPSECSHNLLSEFESVPFPGATLYRKLTDGPQKAEHFEWSAAPVATRLLSLPEIVQATPPPQAEPIKLRDADNATTMASMARECANAGRLNEALEWCGKAIAAEKLNAGYHYLRGAILQECGRLQDAAASLQRALYIEQDFAVAHFALGNLRRQQRLFGEAERHFKNTLDALSKCPPAEPLPESEGITAERLAEIVQAMLQPAMAGQI